MRFGAADGAGGPRANVCSPLPPSSLPSSLLPPHTPQMPGTDPGRRSPGDDELVGGLPREAQVHMQTEEARDQHEAAQRDEAMYDDQHEARNRVAAAAAVE